MEKKKSKGAFPCVYFVKEGYCVKGDHCEFLHERPAPCKTFSSASGCKYGSKCVFSHGKVNAPKAAVSKSQPAVVMEPTATLTETLKTIPGSSVATTAWGFEKEDEIYFYGAAGTAATFERHKRYSEVLGRSTAEIDPGTSSSSRRVCKFFKAGYCLFGDGCRNLHVGDDAWLANVEEQNENVECAICMSLPANKVFGILNKCTCVFCLDCIQNWRREAAAFEKPTQVRMCPLCRVESFYLVPSRVAAPTPDQKSALIAAHRKALAETPCKYFIEGQCPFGTSCFYKHGNETTETPKVAFVMKADGESSVKTEITLADFMKKK